LIVWADIETTGLDPVKDHILEVAVVVTDDYGIETHAMNCLVKPVGLSYDQMVALLPPRVLEMHTKSGLLADLKLAWEGAPSGLSLALRRYEAEQLLVDFVVDAARAHVKYTPDGTTVIDPNPLRATPLAGNTISFDRSFFRAHMPEFDRLFSYRSLDVTALNEIALRMFPNVHLTRPQGATGAVHRAMADVRNSLAQFHHYVTHMMVRDDLVLQPVAS